MTLQSFVAPRLHVAEQLAGGALGGNYADAALLISGLISGVASFAWPGDVGDKKRFVEAWVRYGERPPRISVPLLLPRLRKERPDIAAVFERNRATMFGPGNGVRVVTANEVDADEATLKAELANAQVQVDENWITAVLRNHSHPVVFYEEVRCQLVHEAELGEKASPHAMTMRAADVSYFNHSGTIMEADWEADEMLPLPHMRRIHFHVPWLVELTTRTAAGVDAAAPNGDAPQPNTWWLPKKV